MERHVHQFASQQEGPWFKPELSVIDWQPVSGVSIFCPVHAGINVSPLQP